jgi:hypothetical protein
LGGPLLLVAVTTTFGEDDMGSDVVGAQASTSKPRESSSRCWPWGKEESGGGGLGTERAREAHGLYSWAARAAGYGRPS